MKKSASILLSLTFVAGTIGTSAAQDSEPYFSSYPGMLSQNDCFAAPFDSAENVRTIVNEFTRMAPNVVERVFSDPVYAMRKNNYDCVQFTYDVDGVEVPGFMFRSANAGNDSPVLVYHRGGNGSFGQLKWVNLYLRYLALADHGYTVIGSNLREADEFGGADVDDTRAVLSIVRGMDNVDHNRIALWGVSRGASQMMQVARGRDDVRALIFEAGSADHERSLVTRSEMIEVYQQRVPDFAENREQAMQARSVVYWADELPQVPILILHGDNDEQVNVEQAHLLAAALDESGHEYDLNIYEGAGHDLEEVAREDMFSWLNRVLKP